MRRVEAKSIAADEIIKREGRSFRLNSSDFTVSGKDYEYGLFRFLRKYDDKKGVVVAELEDGKTRTYGADQGGFTIKDAVGWLRRKEKVSFILAVEAEVPLKEEVLNLRLKRADEFDYLPSGNEEPPRDWSKGSDINWEDFPKVVPGYAVEEHMGEGEFPYEALDVIPWEWLPLSINLEKLLTLSADLKLRSYLADTINPQIVSIARRIELGFDAEEYLGLPLGLIDRDKAKIQALIETSKENLVPWEKLKELGLTRDVEYIKANVLRALVAKEVKESPSALTELDVLAKNLAAYMSVNHLTLNSLLVF